MGFNLASVFHLKAQGSIWLLFVFLGRETCSALLYCLFCSNRVGSETCGF